MPVLFHVTCVCTKCGRRQESTAQIGWGGMWVQPPPLWSVSRDAKVPECWCYEPECQASIPCGHHVLYGNDVDLALVMGIMVR